jgi:hypothetical protein
VASELTGPVGEHGQLGARDAVPKGQIGEGFLPVGEFHEDGHATPPCGGIEPIAPAGSMIWWTPIPA